MTKVMTAERVEITAMCTPQWAAVLKNYPDQGLSAQEKQVIDQHLVTCRVCRSSVSAVLKRRRGAGESEKKSPSGGAPK